MPGADVYWYLRANGLRADSSEKQYQPASCRGCRNHFSDRLEDYLPVVQVRVGGIDIYNYSPLIYANGWQNVAVTGPVN